MLRSFVFRYWALDIVCLYMSIHSVIKSCWVIRCVNLGQTLFMTNFSSKSIYLISWDIFFSGVPETVPVFIIRQWTHFLMMKTKLISEIVDSCLKLIQLITWENFTTFSQFENFKLYTLNYDTQDMLHSLRCSQLPGQFLLFQSYFRYEFTSYYWTTASYQISLKAVAYWHKLLIGVQK